MTVELTEEEAKNIVAIIKSSSNFLLTFGYSDNTQKILNELADKFKPQVEIDNF
jgi:hypothetical protein